MFGSKDKPNSINNDVPVMNPNKSASSKDMKTLIGEGCRVEGSFFIPTPTRIDGTIKGDLTGDSGIVIGNKGRIEGNVCAPEVVVFGNIEGNVDANRLELKRGANISGDITVNNLITEQGGIFNGKCNMKVESSAPESHDTLDSNVTELKAETA